MGYYMGDYYAGDPGFLSFLGRAAKSAVGLIPGVGPIAKRALDIIPTSVRKPGFFSGAIRKVSESRVGRAVVKYPALSAAAAGGAIGAGAGMMTRRGGTPAAAGMAAMRGVGGGFRRRRRMRVTNPKALRRAIRRTAGFAKLAMRTIHLIHPKKKVRFGGFKHRRKK